jgi:hypothetical protein
MAGKGVAAMVGKGKVNSLKAPTLRFQAA